MIAGALVSGVFLIGCSQIAEYFPFPDNGTDTPPVEVNELSWLDLDQRELELALDLEDYAVVYHQIYGDPWTTEIAGDICARLHIDDAQERLFIEDRVGYYHSHDGFSSESMSPYRSSMSLSEVNQRFWAALETHEPALYDIAIRLEDIEVANLYIFGGVIPNHQAVEVSERLGSSMVEQNFVVTRINELNQIDSTNEQNFVSPERFARSKQENSDRMWNAVELNYPDFYIVALKVEDSQGAGTYLYGHPYPIEILDQFLGERKISDQTHAGFAGRRLQVYIENFSETGDTFGECLSPRSQILKVRISDELERIYGLSGKLLGSSYKNITTLIFKVDDNATVDQDYDDPPRLFGDGICHYLYLEKRREIALREGLVKPYTYYDYPADEIRLIP